MVTVPGDIAVMWHRRLPGGAALQHLIHRVVVLEHTLLALALVPVQLTDADKAVAGRVVEVLNRTTEAAVCSTVGGDSSQMIEVREIPRLRN